jgi:hypothetical protein
MAYGQTIWFQGWTQIIKMQLNGVIQLSQDFDLNLVLEIFFEIKLVEVLEQR